MRTRYAKDFRADPPPPLQLAAKIPQQLRSKERVRKILNVSRTLIEKHGILDLKMNDIASRARIPIGSVYQFFPTKTALIAHLFRETLESYQQLIREHLEPVQSSSDCATALREMVEQLYKDNRSNTLMQDIWGGAFADREIRALHLWDNRISSRYIFEAICRCGVQRDQEVLWKRCRVVNEMWDGTIRLAITLEEPLGKEVLAESINMGLRELGLTARD